MVTSQGKFNLNLINVIIGVIGGIITYSGMFFVYPQPYYVAGSILLLLTALYFRLYFFVALEIILISGHAAILLGIGTILQVALPILLCFQLLFYYYFSGQSGDFSTFIGILGIALFSIGFPIDSQWVFILGSLSIALYAFFNLEKSNQVSLLWLILNLLFAVSAFVRIMIA